MVPDDFVRRRACRVLGLLDRVEELGRHLGSGRREHVAGRIAFGYAYSDTEIAAVTNYVTSRFGAAPSHIAAADIAKLRRPSQD